MKPWIIGNLLLITWISPQLSEAIISINEDETPVTARFHCIKNGCCDHHEWCRFWASVGECKSNGEWMLDNCQLACNSCRPGAVKPVTAATTRVPLRPFSRRTTTARPFFFHTSPRARATFTTRRPTTLATLRTRPTVQFRTRPTQAPRTLRPIFTQSSTSSSVRLVMLRRNRGRGGISHRVPPLRRVPTKHIPSIAELTDKFHLNSGTTARSSTRRVTIPFTQLFFTTTTPITTEFTTSSTTTTTPMPATTTFAISTTTVPTTTILTTLPPTTTTTTATTTTMPTTTTTTTTTPSTTTTTTTPSTTTSTISVTTPEPTTTTELISTTQVFPTPSFENSLTTTLLPETVFPTSRETESSNFSDKDPRLRTRPTTRAPFRAQTTTQRTTLRTTTRTTPRTTPRTTTTTRAPTTQPFRRLSNAQTQRCRQIINDPLVAAEEMIREKLVVAVEDNNNRRSIDLDQVIRSNLANACVPRMDETDCEANLCYNAYFRTMDGTCNNLDNPLRGASYRPYTRLLPTVYDNELSEPVGSLFPELRPSPREITRQLTSSHASVEADDYNAMVMQFGQFLSHDMAKTTLVPSSKCNVCQNITSRCMAVPVTGDDPNLGFKRNTCVRVSRSSAICGSGRTKPRQQLNENTGYIDVSPIYGSSVHDSLKFRDGKSGFLKLPTFRGFEALPFDQSKCKSRQSCTVIFTAGDSRVNLFVGLSAWHTIFTKEHNRLVTQFKRLNPHWDGERLYQEARKLVGAQMQAIVYREWLPKVLGAAFATVVGDYKGYDPNVDSTIANEFTSAAFRFGHGMIQEFYQRLDPNFSNSTFGPLVFQKGTLHSDVLLNEGGPDPLLRGMFSQHVKRPQRVTTTVTENMFGSTDLSSINIQRGRDHGHPSYTKYRELCGMGIASDFDELAREILNTGTREKLRKVYGNVDKIDLWVGALLEDPVVRGLVGPTVACVIGPQFKRTRDGDRFYYERPGVFTRQQLSEVRKSSLSRIICDNSQTITMVPREAFRIGHLTPCSQIPSMDLSKWKEF